MKTTAACFAYWPLLVNSSKLGNDLITNWLLIVIIKVMIYININYCKVITSIKSKCTTSLVKGVHVKLITLMDVHQLTTMLIVIAAR